MVGAKILFWEPSKGYIPSEKEIQRDQTYKKIERTHFNKQCYQIDLTQLLVWMDLA